MGTLSYSYTLQTGKKPKPGPVNDNFQKVVDLLNRNLDENNIKSTTNLTINSLTADTKITSTLIESTGDIIITSTGSDFDVYDSSATKVFNIDNDNGITITGDYEALAVGTIIPFSGTFTNNTTIPGWYKCDGNNGTVNLVNKFIKGVSDTEGTGSHTGGTDDATLIEHTHDSSTLVSGGVSHTHSLSANTAALTKQGTYTHKVYGNTSNDSGAWTGLYGNYSDVTHVGITTTDTSDNHRHWMTSLSIGSSSTHTHTVTINNAGTGDGTGDNIPAYYSLVFIQRIS